MAKDTDNSKNHTREIAVGVPDKHLGRIPVVEEQGERDAYPREEEVE